MQTGKWKNVALEDCGLENLFLKIVDYRNVIFENCGLEKLPI